MPNFPDSSDWNKAAMKSFWMEYGGKGKGKVGGGRSGVEKSLSDIIIIYLFLWRDENKID